VELAKRLNYTLILDIASENPFLSSFYNSPRGHAFQTQIYFLLSRVRELRKLLSPALFGGVVTDITMARDRIYARVNLNDEEFALYEQIANELQRGLNPPEAVILLYASPEYLYYHLRKRGIKKVEEEYLEKLAGAFSEYYYRNTTSGLLIVDVESVDFVKHPEEVGRIVELLPARGVRYYSVKPSIF